MEEKTEYRVEIAVQELSANRVSAVLELWEKMRCRL